MDNLHFFMFSSGEYSDYCVGGMYVCDHVVTKDEWEQFVADKLAKRQKAREDSMLKYRTRAGVNIFYYGVPEGWYESDEYEEYHKYCDENCMRDLFIKAHNMCEVKYTELWDY
jgi:hypothetical protein